jgi:hypothetical protein
VRKADCKREYACALRASSNALKCAGDDQSSGKPALESTAELALGAEGQGALEDARTSLNARCKKAGLAA